MLKILLSAAVVIGTLKVKMCALIYLPVVSATVLPAKSDSDVIFCLQLLSKTLTCTLHMCYCELMYHLCINPIL